MKDELEDLVSEVESMQSLTGILLMNLKKTTSMVSLPNYPRDLSPGWSKMSEKRGQEKTVTKSLKPMMGLKNEGSQTKTKSLQVTIALVQHRAVN